MIYSFFNPQTRFQHFLYFWFLVSSCYSPMIQFCLQFFTTTKSCLGIFDEVISEDFKNKDILFFPFSAATSGLCLYHFFTQSNLSHLHNSQSFTYPTRSCLIFCSLWSRLLHYFVYLLVLLCLYDDNQDDLLN